MEHRETEFIVLTGTWNRINAGVDAALGWLLALSSQCGHTLQET